MTPLKTPIVLRIETVENALNLVLMNRREFEPDKNPRHFKLWTHKNKGEVNEPLVAALEAQGIDWQTWESPQPLLIGTHKVEPQPDGSIKVGCTTVTRATLLKVLALSDAEVKKEAVSEWPKWFYNPDYAINNSNASLLKVESDAPSVWFQPNTGKQWKGVCNLDLEYWKSQGYKPITAAEAAEILKTTNK